MDNDESDCMVKQIGKGSFSNVYLYKKKSENFAPVVLSVSQIENTTTEHYYIIKEININTLIKKYLRETKSKHHDQNVYSVINKKVFNDITPYSMNKRKMFYNNTEYEYYYERLKQLIDSEINVLCSLDHHNIISFYTYTLDDGIYNLHMEYCNMGDLYNIIKSKSNIDNLIQKNKKGGLIGKSLVEFITQITIALEYIHDQKIIHRDIKPHNILLHQVNNNVIFKLSDFGFSCYDLTKMEHDDYDKCILSNKYFKMCGSPYYMAPELITNMNLLENFTNYNDLASVKYDKVCFYDAKVDVYSFGICLYETITNTLPLPKVHNIKELCKFYKNSSGQQFTDSCIFKNDLILPIFQELIGKLLRIDPQFRCDSTDIVAFITQHKIEIETSTFSSLEHDLSQMSLNSLNNSILNQPTILKQHIVHNPINSNIVGTIGNVTELEQETTHDSWQNIDNNASIIGKVSVDHGILEWLLKNITK